jgi:hypothetical protein
MYATHVLQQQAAAAAAAHSDGPAGFSRLSQAVPRSLKHLLPIYMPGAMILVPCMPHINYMIHAPCSMNQQSAFSELLLSSSGNTSRNGIK